MFNTPSFASSRRREGLLYCSALLFYSTELDQEIPAGLYLAVAQVLAYVYQLRQFQAGKGKRPAPLADLPIPPELRRDA